MDTAGLTRIRTDKSLLLASKEKRKMRVESTIGKNVRVTQRSGSSTYSAVELPGIQLLNPEADPSKFSHQVYLYFLLSFSLQLLPLAVHFVPHLNLLIVIQSFHTIITDLNIFLTKISSQYFHSIPKGLRTITCLSTECPSIFPSCPPRR